jgi:hypothetical protein
VKIYVKDGTPVEGQSRCATCTHAHVMQGFRETEEVTYCTFACELIRVPFKVRDCSNYADRHRPTWAQMEELAIDILPLCSAKPAGFRSSGDHSEESGSEVQGPELLNS